MTHDTVSILLSWASFVVGAVSAGINLAFLVEPVPNAPNRVVSGVGFMVCVAVLALSLARLLVLGGL